MPLTKHIESGTQPASVIHEALEAVRKHLDMDIAYVSEVRDDQVAFIHVACDGHHPVVAVDHRVALQDIYCLQIANGDLPYVVADVQVNPVTRDLPFVKAAKVGAFISAPIVRSDGTQYGNFCCFSHTARHDITQRDLDTMQMFASLTTRSLTQYFDAQQEIQALKDQLNGVILNDSLSIFLQPIVALSDQRPMAAEALTRFHVNPSFGPEWWFQQAQRTDMQIELEVKAIAKALSYIDAMPDRLYLSVNASPITVASAHFMEAVRDVPPDRLLVELTEREVIHETVQLMQSLQTLREKRIGIAVDDVGAGYAGLSTIVSLKPNVLKLDRTLVSDINNCTVKQSLTKAMVHFSAEMDAFLVAEGVETLQEDQCLKSLGVRLGQGFFYARPTEATEMCQSMHVMRNAAKRLRQAS